MSIKVRWKALAACAALALAVTACGGDDKKTDDDKDPVGNGGDGGGNGSNGNDGTNNGNTSSGSNDGDGGGWTPPPPLEPGVVGKACTADEDCGEGGECRDPLQGGLFGGVSLGGSGPTGGYCSRSCTENADCGDGGVCFGTGRRGGECRKACSSDSECGRDNYECAKLNRPVTAQDGTNVEVPQTCQPLRTPVKFSDQVANACSDDAMCGDANAVCRMSGSFPGGYCSGSCNSDADCGAEGLCLLRQYGAGGSCYEKCAVDTDCKRDTMNYGCIEANDTGTLVCAGEMDPLTDGVVGIACTDDTMCGNGQCATRLGVEQVEAPGGYCSITGCEEDIECGAGGSCVPSDRGSRCYKPCAADTDCRAGYACTSRGTAAKMVNVCFPIAVAGDAGP